MYKSIVVILAAALTSSCASIMAQKRAERAPTKLGGESTEALTVPSQLRAIMIRSRDDAQYVCAEPAPDVAMSDTLKLVTALSVERAANASLSAEESSSSSGKATASNDLQATTTALQLAGRTQTVLLAREFLFRVCEAAANGHIQGSEVYASHQEILKRISDMVKADEKASTAASVVAASVATQGLDPNIISSSRTLIDGTLDAQCMSTFRSCLSSAKDAAAGDVCQKTFEQC